MSDQPTPSAETPKTPETRPVPEPGAPTPEELIAETQEGDPEVGADGTGMGELP